MLRAIITQIISRILFAERQDQIKGRAIAPVPRSVKKVVKPIKKVVKLHPLKTKNIVCCNVKVRKAKKDEVPKKISLGSSLKSLYVPAQRLTLSNVGTLLLADDLGACKFLELTHQLEFCDQLFILIFLLFASYLQSQ